MPANNGEEGFKNKSFVWPTMELEGLKSNLDLRPSRGAFVKCPLPEK